jgi:predicted nucleotidyltransferase
MKSPLEQGLIIRVVTPPYFCATKITAFHGRGNGDYAASHDLEDFLSVVDGRVELLSELRAAEDDVRTYVATEVREFLSQSEFVDMLPGSLTPDAASQARMPLLMARLEEIASL